MRFLRDVLSRLAFLRPLFALVIASAMASGGLAQNFAQPKVIPTGNWPAAVYSADIDGDGYPDLIYIDQGATPGQPSTTHVLLNDGKGNFTQSATIATVGNSLGIADLDGDGKIDISWAAKAPSTNLQLYPSQINAYIASSLGGGRFATARLWGSIPIAASLTPIPVFVTAAQFQGSGHPYLLVQDQANQLIAFVTDRAPYGNTIYTQTLPDGVGPMLLGTLKPGSNQDYAIIGANGTLDIFYPTGNGGVGPSPQGYADERYTGTGRINSALFADVNFDGILDLVAEGANGHIDVFFGNGDGTFQTTSSGGTGPVDGLTGNGGHLIALGDYNHDGLLDALTATPIGVSTLLGQGTQYLGLKGIYNAGPAVDLPQTTYAVADFNQDGNSDLALPSPEGIAILFGNADGSFQTSQAFAAGQPAMSGALGRFTSLTHLDAVVSTGSAQAQVLLGDGTGTFKAYGGATSPVPTTPQNGIPGLWSSVIAGPIYAFDLLDDIAITADGASSASNGGVLIPSTSAGAPSGLIVQRGNNDGTFAAPIGITGALSGQQTAGSPASFYGVSAPWDANSIIFTRDGSAYRYSGDENFTPTPNSLVFGTQTTYTNHPHNLIAAGNQIVVAQQEGDLFVYVADLTSRVPILGDLAVDGSLTTRASASRPTFPPRSPDRPMRLVFAAFRARLSSPTSTETATRTSSSPTTTWTPTTPRPQPPSPTTSTSGTALPLTAGSSPRPNIRSTRSASPRRATSTRSPLPT